MKAEDTPAANRKRSRPQRAKRKAKRFKEEQEEVWEPQEELLLDEEDGPEDEDHWRLEEEFEDPSIKIRRGSEPFTKFGLCRWQSDGLEEDAEEAAHIVVQAGSKLMSEAKGKVSNISWHATGKKVCVYSNFLLKKLHFSVN